MRGTVLVVAIAFIECGAVAAVTQLSGPEQAAIDGYRSAIASAESGSSPGAIEAALTALRSVRGALMRERDGQRTVLESLSEEAFARLERELPGIIITREEVVLVEPDVRYFEKLAAARGDGADRAFFAALRATYPESIWPVYIERQTDVSGCTRFGSGSLISSYLAWVGFRRQYPRRYTVEAEQHAGAVVKELTESTCACGDLASVEQELEEFRRRAPASDVRARVDQRLAAIRTTRSSMRLSCVAR